MALVSTTANPKPVEAGLPSCKTLRDARRRSLGAGPLEGDQQTNNRAELTAVIKGLQALKTPGSTVEVVTDSTYVKNGCTSWLANWKRNGWRTADRKPVANADLWQLLDQLLAEHKVHLQWVRGHSGHPENERADALAQRAALGERIERYGH